MMEQQKQFLDVIDCDLEKSRFEAAISLEPLEEEMIDLNQAIWIPVPIPYVLSQQFFELKLLIFGL